MKTSQFLIAENPLVEDGRTFVIHTRDPLILCEAHHFRLNQIAELNACRSNYNLGIKVEYQGKHIFLGVDKIGHTLLDADKMDGLLKRMGDWYHAYLNATL